VLLGGRHPELRSAVVCLEDSIREDETGAALDSVRRLLLALAAAPAGARRPAVFIRPRSAPMLLQVLELPGVDAVDGFVIPKATADSLPAYLSVLTNDRHAIMPTLETREVFDPAEIKRLRDQLVAVQERVLAIRIGGNDLLQVLGARRSTRRTAYDGPLGPVIAHLVGAFAPYGFALSAPVLEAFGDPALLREEVERDLEHGLLTKTAIHPDQIAVIQDGYRVGPADFATAQAMLRGDARAVYANDRVMNEPATHRAWARTILARAAAFGLTSAPEARSA
jgi:citrate lyase beta subunit